MLECFATTITKIYKEYVMSIPKDPMMLLSFINMKLRDFYPSLDDLCLDLNLDKEQIISSLKDIDYEYDKTLNKFI